jgi:hypothetical protein
VRAEFLREGIGFWRPVVPPSPLADAEVGLVRALVAHTFPDSEQLRRQIPTLAVIARSPTDASFRVPVLAEGRDAAGRRVTVLLHVVGGFMGEVEVVHEDDSVGLPLLEGLLVY